MIALSMLVCLTAATSAYSATDTIIHNSIGIGIGITIDDSITIHNCSNNENSSIDSDSEVGDDGPLLEEVVEWVISKGGWISDKVSIQQLRPGLATLVAHEPLQKGEVVANIPWKAILDSKPDDDTSWCEQVEEVRDAISKDSALQTPYERYLASRSREHIPMFWSRKSKSVLAKLVRGHDLFTMHGFESDYEAEWLEECEMPSDDAHIDAMMLLQTRGEGEDLDLLIPFGDLLNHRNGNYTNVDPEIDYEKSYKLVATRDVQAGEQLQNSYNKCSFCDGLYDNANEPQEYYVTPQLFEVYGFVELLPQRWILPEARLMFDITGGGDGTGEVGESDDNRGLRIDFVAPPSVEGLTFLQRELVMLDKFKKRYGNSTDLPRPEYDGIFSMHGAMVKAFSLALEQTTGQDLSDHVWEMGMNWHREDNHWQIHGISDEL